MKILTVLGTRPEIIRLSLIIKKLDKHCNHILVHTGQNDDHELSEIFFDDLSLRKPDIYMDIKTKSLGAFLSGLMLNFEKILIKEKPDAVLCLGDTNSSLATIIAKRLSIPVYHMEAGNRSFDLNTPEEINRKIVDHTADINLVYTENARRNLLSEGFHPKLVYKTGSPLKELINENLIKINKTDVLKKYKLSKNNYIAVSIHRQENVNDSKQLKSIIELLNYLAEKFKKKVFVSLHPRTKDIIYQNKLDGFIGNKLIMSKPLSFTEYLSIQKHSFCVISDSGSISEESAILNFPAVTLRKSIERPEANDSASIFISDLNDYSLENAVNFVTKKNQFVAPPDYLIENTSDIVVSLILGTSGLVKYWQNRK